MSDLIGNQKGSIDFYGERLEVTWFAINTECGDEEIHVMGVAGKDADWIKENRDDLAGAIEEVYHLS